MHTACRLLIVLGLLFSLSFQASHAQAQASQAWHGLPEETVVAFQLPGGTASVEALRTQTRLGQLLFSPERRAVISDMMQESAGEDLAEFTEAMQRYQLSMDDLPQLFAGPVGVGLVVEPREQRPPLFVVLAWLEPGEALGDRIMNAMAMAVEEAQDEEAPIKRVDFELAGERVMHLSIPEMGTDREEHFELPEDFDFEDPEAFQQHLQQREAVQVNWVAIDQTNLFITRRGSRLLVAMTAPQSADQVRAIIAQGQEIDWKTVTGVDRATAILARFIDSQERGDGAFARNVLTTPGIQKAVAAQGLPMYELFFSAESLLKLAEAQGEVDGVNLRALLGRLGVDTVKAGVIRGVLQGQMLRQDVFLAAPAPRRGLLSLIDQQPLPPEPAAWVPADATEYSHISADLGVIYRTIREFAMAEGGEEAAAGFAQIEQPVRDMLQVELHEVLSSLGQRHTIAKLGINWVEVEVPDYENFNPETGDFPMKTESMPQEKVAYVWELRNEDIWKQLFQMLNQFVPMTNGMVQPSEEQGFTGYRAEMDPMKIGLFLGAGRLVIGAGDDLIEPLLSSVRNPPAGEAALRNSKAFTDTTRLLTLRPSILFTYYNLRVSAHDTRRAFAFLAEQVDMPEAQVDRLLPSAEELAEAMAGGVGQVFYDDHGLVGESVMELPPAR